MEIKDLYSPITDVLDVEDVITLLVEETSKIEQEEQQTAPIMNELKLTSIII